MPADCRMIEPVVPGGDPPVSSQTTFLMYRTYCARGDPISQLEMTPQASEPIVPGGDPPVLGPDPGPRYLPDTHPGRLV